MVLGKLESLEENNHERSEATFNSLYNQIINKI